MIWSRSTSDGRYDWYATSKNTCADADEEADDVQLPERERRRRRRRSGCVASSTARPRSPTMRIGLRRRRSTQTPAGSVKRMNGRNTTMPSAATSNAARVEHEDRDEGNREVGDLRPEQADRLRRPELEEVAVAPEAAVRPEATHRAPRPAARRPSTRVPVGRGHRPASRRHGSRRGAGSRVARTDRRPSAPGGT